MNITQMIKDTASGSLGNIEKAIVEIIDCRGQTISKEEAVSAKGGAGFTQGISLGNTSLLQKTFSSLQSKGMMIQNPIQQGATRKFFYVQFNPGEISLSGYGGGQMAKTDFSDQEKSISYEKVNVRITMDVKLVFDQVNVKDAFMADKWNTAPTALATGLVQGGLSLAGKKEYSVQKEMEAFVAAIRSPYTRKINFYWGDLFYGGILHRVSSQYTMFNVQGQPVRGEVRLSITCADESISETNMGKWKEQYNKAFKNQNHSYVKSVQKVGNLLNFNI